MKSSMYNLFVPIDESEYVLYNFLNDSALIVDEDMKLCIEKGELNSSISNQSVKETLLNCGVIVHDDINERKLYLYRYNIEKYAPSYSLFIVLTTFACNLSCPYCYEGSGEILNSSMDEQTLLKVIDFIKKTTHEDGTREIAIKLYGGEPLLCLDSCYAISKELSKWGDENNIKVNIVLQTNGTLLNENAVRLLTPYLAAVEVTLDGPPESHNKSRCYKNGDGSYEDILRNISLLAGSKTSILLRLNVENSDGLGLLLDNLDKNGLKSWPNLSFYTAHISYYDLCEFFTNDELCLKDINTVLEIRPSLLRVIYEKGWQSKYHMYNMRKQKLVSCNNEKRGRYVVDPLGDIYKCVFTAGDKAHRVGVIKDGGVEWNSAYYDILTRNPLDMEGCADCVYLPNCGGGCASRAFLNKESFNASYCGPIKRIMSKRILLYLKEIYPEKFSRLVI
ncbi:MAG: molybdenum cofactor biosynthesis protein A [Methanosaeta sp. PtaU1.Bin112]|nr:MAG: molybdenum cofactor biosynthesis protein A [Methanosaeta sp. PtaU1.Bin112]